MYRSCASHLMSRSLCCISNTSYRPPQRKLKRVASMRITLGKSRFSMPQPFFGTSQLLANVLEILTTNVLQFDSLEKIPNTLLGI